MKRQRSCPRRASKQKQFGQNNRPHSTPFRSGERRRGRGEGKKAMGFPRRQFLHLAAGAVALPAVSRAAWALDYPTRPVRILVGFPPGAATDIVARLIAQELSQRLGQQFFVENKPGAASNLAAEMVAQSPPDGYTLLAHDRHQCGQHHALRTEARLRFHARHRAGRQHDPVGQCARGQSRGPGQNRSGIHRLRQGQSGQAQLRLVRTPAPRPIWPPSCSR